MGRKSEQTARDLHRRLVRGRLEATTRRTFLGQMGTGIGGMDVIGDKVIPLTDGGRRRQRARPRAAGGCGLEAPVGDVEHAGSPVRLQHAAEQRAEAMRRSLPRHRATRRIQKMDKAGDKCPLSRHTKTRKTPPHTRFAQTRAL